MNKCVFYLFTFFFRISRQEENFYFINKINCLCIITLWNKSKFSRMFFQNALIFGNAFSELNPLMNNIISNEDFIQLSLINGLIRNSLEKTFHSFL